MIHWLEFVELHGHHGGVKFVCFHWLRLQWVIVYCSLIPLGLAANAADNPSSNPQWPTITNVLQFQRLVSLERESNCPVRLEGVVCWADLSQGMVVLQDNSGTALVEMDPKNLAIQPGQRILLAGTASEGSGGASLKVGGLTLIDDHLHGMDEHYGSLSLKAGIYPISASWFNRDNLYGFDIFYEGPNLARQSIPDFDLCHEVIAKNGETNWVEGLHYRAYEGQWSALPDFQKLTPVQMGITTNFDVEVKPRDKYVGLEFDGYLEIHQDGVYGLSLALDGRKQLFIENPQFKIIDEPGIPVPHHVTPGQILSEKEQSFWAETEGTVTFVSKTSNRLKLELKSENGDMRVDIADSSGGLSSFLLGSQIRIIGICRSTYGLNGQIIPGAMWLPDFGQVKLLKVAPEFWTSHPVVAIGDLLSTNLLTGTIVHIIGRVRSTSKGRSLVIQDGTGSIILKTFQPMSDAIGDYVGVLGKWNKSGTNIVLSDGFCRKIERMSEATNPLPILTTAEEVKRLKRDEALRGYPVKIRGVVTWSGGSGFVIQDSTMGIFAEAVNPESSGAERDGEYLEVEGVTTAQFSPMVLAQQIVHLGLGDFPEPVHPTWDQLMDGTLDTQYAEIQGIVTVVTATSVTLLTHDGKLQVDLPEMRHAQLERYADALIRIRGCLWAVKNEVTHVLVPGEIQIHDASISVDQAAPRDLFDAPLKHASELLLFDARASALQRVRVIGQIVYQRDGEYYLMDETNGLRFIPRTTASLKIGDVAEVVGFPLLGGPSPVLREAVVRQIGHSNLPAPRQLSENAILNGSYDSTLVKVKAQLMNISEDQRDRILGLQIGQHMFTARYIRKLGPLQTTPIGSRLELTGVYVGQGGDRVAGRDIDSFELLLNSPADIRVLARPSWWTIRRMLAAMGLLVGILAAAMVWIGLLHRQVEQRTGQLKEEILVRQRAEQQRAVEEERSRIARDLHDDLGSSLTEISLLADAGAGWPPVLEKAGKRFQTIGDKARAVVHALDVIVWLVNPRKDFLPFLVGYLGSYAEEYLTAAGIVCRLKVPSDIPSLRLTSHVRHNLFLAMKETLHNIVRHSQATEVTVEMTTNVTQLKVVISDNGHGFNPENMVEGNGLLNLHDRLANIGGQCQITSRLDAGTMVSFALPLSDS